MATKMYFGGTESHTHWKRLYQYGVKRVLASFYHLQDRAYDALKTRKQANPDISVFLDSGGFSFQDAERAGWGEDDYRKFLEKYLIFLNDNKDVLDAAVEMDLEHIFGYGEVRKWQDQYFEPLERAGLPIIYIWHAERGIGEWEEMCKRHRFVGVNEMAFEKMSADHMMSIARKYLTKVHGFALTRQWVFQNMGLATADSVTWKSGEKFHTFFTFIDGEFKRHKPDQIKKQESRFRKYTKDCGGDYDKILSGDYKEFAKMAIIAHLKMQEYCDSLAPLGYYDYRLPDPNKILKLSNAEVEEKADLLSHFSDEPLSRFDLQVLSAMQNGKWDFFDDNRNKYDAHDSFVKLMGENCDISFTNEERRLELRQRACLRSVPSLSTEAQKRITEDETREVNPPKKRQEYASPRY